MTERKDLPAGGYFVMPRYLPIAVFVILIGWTVTGAWYASKIDSRIGSLERRTVIIETTAMERQRERDRLTVVEQQVSAIRENQDRQNAVLERIEKRLASWPAPRSD